MNISEEPDIRQSLTVKHFEPLQMADRGIEKDEVHLYLLNVRTFLTDIETKAKREVLINLVRSPDGRNASRVAPSKTAGYIFRKMVLSAYSGIKPEDIQLSYGQYGKPCLAPEQNREGISFNLSHSGDYLALVIAGGGEVGCDIEKKRPIANMAAVADKIFSKQELTAFNSLPDPQKSDYFFSVWSSKEAVGKAGGLGMWLTAKKLNLSDGIGRRLTPPALDGISAMPEGHETTLHLLPLISGYSLAVASIYDPRLFLPCLPVIFIDKLYENGQKY